MPSGCCLLVKVKSLEWYEQNSERNDAICTVQNFLDSFELTQRTLSFNYPILPLNPQFSMLFFCRGVRFGRSCHVSCFRACSRFLSYPCILVFTLSLQKCFARASRFAQAATSVGWTTSWCGFIQCWDQQLWSLQLKRKQVVKCATWSLIPKVDPDTRTWYPLFQKRSKKPKMDILIWLSRGQVVVVPLQPTLSCWTTSQIAQTNLNVKNDDSLFFQRRWQSTILLVFHKFKVHTAFSLAMLWDCWRPNPHALLKHHQERNDWQRALVIMSTVTLCQLQPSVVTCSAGGWIAFISVYCMHLHALHVLHPKMLRLAPVNWVQSTKQNHLVKPMWVISSLSLSLVIYVISYGIPNSEQKHVVLACRNCSGKTEVFCSWIKTCQWVQLLAVKGKLLDDNQIRGIQSTCGNNSTL